tara:strand:- start:258 stop:455 length:198 start_codon:yes stop_codon:yes gene_type:complete
MIYKGIEYFATFSEAREVCKTLEGKQIDFFGEKVTAGPRIVSYQLGHAVQYIRSGDYYPQQELAD